MNQNDLRVGDKVNVGLIGYGYWGINLLRNIIENRNSGTVTVCDLMPEKLKSAKAIYPSIEVSSEWQQLIDNPDINAIVVATPTSTHYEIVKAGLQKGKHILAEKPLVTSAKQMEELNQLAARHKCVLMADHTFLYNDVVRKMKSYIKDGEIGRINYIDSTRINLGIYQKDINVLWDLACHDISIINYIIEEQPVQLRAIGRIHPASATEDLAYLFLYYPSGLLVQINTSWASPVKIRKIMVGGEKKMMIYNDIEPTNKLIIYDYEAIEFTDENKQMLVDYRLGNISIPKYHLIEPLKRVMEDFFDSILNNATPLSNGTSALQVIKILEKAELSIKSKGALIDIN